MAYLHFVLQRKSPIFLNIDANFRSNGEKKTDFIFDSIKCSLISCQFLSLQFQSIGVRSSHFSNPIRDPKFRKVSIKIRFSFVKLMSTSCRQECIVSISWDVSRTECTPTACRCEKKLWNIPATAEQQNYRLSAHSWHEGNPCQMCSLLLSHSCEWRNSLVVLHPQFQIATDFQRFFAVLLMQKTVSRNWTRPKRTLDAAHKNKRLLIDNETVNIRFRLRWGRQKGKKVYVINASILFRQIQGWLFRAIAVNKSCFWTN